MKRLWAMFCFLVVACVLFASGGVEEKTEAAGKPYEGVSINVANMLGSVSDDVLTKIFPMKQEPYLTLANAYHSNDLFPYRASALLIALAMYMDTLPQEK